MMRSLWQGDVRSALIDRSRRLRPEARPVWGRFTCLQMLTHLNDWLHMANGDLETVPLGLPLRHPPLRQLMIYVLPFPRGVSTAPELLARIDAGVWDQEAAAFPTLLERFAARGPDAAMPVHPAFGPLSRRAWGVHGYRHVDHHFRQFGV
jgi:hypothetical protein